MAVQIFPAQAAQVEDWLVVLVVLILGLMLLAVLLRGAGIPVTGQRRAGVGVRPWLGIGAPSERDAAYMSARHDLGGLLRLLLYQGGGDNPAALVRYSAAEALGELDDLRAVGPLIRALADPHSSVRAAAARSLGKLGSPRRPLGESGAGPTVRSRILAALFPCVERDPANEVRWAAADALYRTGGGAVLRPLVAVVRRRFSEGEDTVAGQRWFVDWAAASGLENLLIDVYPWFYPSTRRAIASVLRTRLTPGTLTRLALARDSGDPDLSELAMSVLGSH